MQFNLVFNDNSYRKLNNFKVSMNGSPAYLLCCNFKNIANKNLLRLLNNPIWLFKDMQKSHIGKNITGKTAVDKVFLETLSTAIKNKSKSNYSKTIQFNNDYDNEIYLYDLVTYEKIKNNKIYIFDKLINYEKKYKDNKIFILENYEHFSYKLKKAISLQNYLYNAPLTFSMGEKGIVTSNVVQFNTGNLNISNIKPLISGQDYNNKLVLNEYNQFVNMKEKMAHRQYKNYFIDKCYSNLYREYSNIFLYKIMPEYNYVNKIITASINKKDTTYFRYIKFMTISNKKIFTNEYLTAETNKHSILNQYKELMFDTKIKDAVENKIVQAAAYTKSVNMSDIYAFNIYEKNIEYNNSLIQIDTILKDIYMTDLLSADTDNKKVFYKDLLSIETPNKKLYICDFKFLKAPERKLYINSDIQIDYDARKFSLINKEIYLKRKKYNLYDINKINNKGFNTFKRVHLKERPPFKENYEFVTVLDTYDKDDGEGIDELLLPHKDYDYSIFLKQMLNEDGTIKPEYITGYDHDKMLYRVKLPIENPISIYKKIGREYIDLDVSFLNFFVNLIKARWKSKMYTYAAMNSIDVLVDIMNYLFDYYTKKYTEDDIELKYMERCMQLFRWFSEMAVLNNSEYELQFGTKKIEIDYYNKCYNDFANMTEINNMHISNDYVLEPVDPTLPCSIKFTNNKKSIMQKLNLHFKLYNMASNTSILITDDNNTVTKTVYDRGIHELNLELENKIEIRYEPTDINQNIAITSTDISNIPTRNFTLRYIGKVGEINSVLKELCERLLIDTANGITKSDRKIIDDVSPAAEAIYQMIKYYDLHHKGKKKGKRLTIKK